MHSHKHSILSPYFLISRSISDVFLTLLYPFPSPNFFQSIFRSSSISILVMSIDEVQNININQAPAPAPPLAPTALPPYPEMIIAAIEALDDKSGSSKSAISRQIEATYGDLPPAHIALLTHHLDRMKSLGQIAFLKNNYLKPDPNAPPRRGRGRPPKAKTSLPAEVVPSSPRPRGRPPKSHDPADTLSPAKPKAASASPPPPVAGGGALSGRKRGRPPKAGSAAVGVRALPVSSGPPRGRGRPPKVKPSMAAAPVGA